MFIFFIIGLFSSNIYTNMQKTPSDDVELPASTRDNKQNKVKI